jgi:hypothetical protein
MYIGWMFMDTCLELLLPHMVQVDGLEHRQVSFTWGGLSYPQGAGSLYWGDVVELVQTPIPRHLRRYLPADSVTDNWIALSIRGKGLDLLQDEVNGSPVDWKGRSLEQLLRLLLSQSKRWVLVFELHCDQIDNVYRMNLDQCIERLRQNLLWDVKAEGFVVIPPEQEGQQSWL